MKKWATSICEKLWGAKKKLRGGETILDDDLLITELPWLGPRGFRGFSDGNHEADDMVGGEIDELCDGIEVESIHRAASIAHSLCSEHQGHAKHSAGAHNFVTLNVGFALVIIRDGTDDEIASFLGDVAPVSSGVFFPSEEVAGDDDKERSIGYLRLIPSNSADLLAQLRVGDDDGSPVLDVESRGGLHCGFEEFADFVVGHAIGGVEAFD